MGQYFAAANTDKKEFVCPWCVGGVAKLWEWAANPWGAIFCLLLRKSDRGGGGDYYGYPMQEIQLSGKSPQAVLEALASVHTLEGRPVESPSESIVGRWAGDRVVLVGDYDSSGIWDELYEKRTYRNVSEELVEAWNDFIELPERKLTFRADCSCWSPND